MHATRSTLGTLALLAALAAGPAPGQDKKPDPPANFDGARLEQMLKNLGYEITHYLKNVPTVQVPDGARLPDQSPDAVHVVMFCDDQLSVAVWFPAWTLVGETDRSSVGAGADTVSVAERWVVAPVLSVA